VSYEPEDSVFTSTHCVIWRELSRHSVLHTTRAKGRSTQPPVLQVSIDLLQGLKLPEREALKSSFGTGFHCLFIGWNSFKQLNQSYKEWNGTERLAKTAALPCTYRFWSAKLLFWLLPLCNGVLRGAVNTICRSARVCDTKKSVLDHLAVTD
jgi:hypothetical protein